MNIKPLLKNQKARKEKVYQKYECDKYIANWYCVICGKPIKWDWCNTVYFPHLQDYRDVCEECWGKYTIDNIEHDNLFTGDYKKLKRKRNYNKKGCQVWEI